VYTALAYGDGQLRAVSDLQEIADLLADPFALVWLDLHNPDEHELEMLASEFGFHQLAIEDVRRGHQRPKVDEYEGYYFFVMYSVAYGVAKEGAGGEFQANEVDIFMGKNYLVTAHRNPVRELEEAIHRWESYPEMVKAGRAGFLLYTICDSIVDNYFPAMDRIEDVIDALEERVFVAFDQQSLGAVFALRKDLLSFRKVVAPERDVFSILTRRDIPVLGSEDIVFFVDVHDHLLRVSDMIETYRDLLAGVLDGYLSMTSNNLNEIMKVLTAGAIILMGMSLIAAIYGMNFKNMPELEWTLGYPWAFGLMASVAALLFIYFRRRRWL